MQNDLLDGWECTSLIKSYPADDYRLYDMIGNVWEWTQDCYAPPGFMPKKSGCCIPANP